LFGAEQLSVAHRPTHDAPQDVAASLIGGKNAIGDQETCRAQVIGDDLVARRARALRLDAGRLDRGTDQRPEQVDVVIVVHALHDGRNALEPHARIDRRPGQVDPLIGRKLLKLHEDEIPDLDKPVTILIGTTGRATRNEFAFIINNYRAHTAQYDNAHGPDISIGSVSDDA